jgi:hypothetical protein
MAAPSLADASLLRSMVPALRGDGKRVIAVQYPGAEPGDKFEGLDARPGRVGVVIAERT